MPKGLEHAFAGLASHASAEITIRSRRLPRLLDAVPRDPQSPAPPALRNLPGSLPSRWKNLRSWYPARARKSVTHIGDLRARARNHAELSPLLRRSQIWSV